MTRSRHDEMREVFEAFHVKHPEVWRLFQKFTFQKIAQGFKHYSAHSIIMAIRWHTDQAPGASERQFKINNNFSPFYARAFMEIHKEHRGFFRLRKQYSKDNPPVCLPELEPRDFELENGY